MADSSSRRRSPESSRRRRRERRAASRERTNATTADFAPSVVPAPTTNYYDASTPGPTMQDRSAPVDIGRQQNGYRARHGSSSSGSSSTGSSLLDISRRYSGEQQRGGVFQTFFRAPSERRRLRRRRSGKNKKRVLYFGNSSSSSLNSDLAYGTGYIPRRKSSRDFSQRHHHQNSAPVAAAAAAGATYATMQNQGPLYPQGPSQHASSHGHSQSYSHPPPQHMAQGSTSWGPGATAATAAAGGAAVGLAADYYNQDRQFPAKPATPKRRKTDDEIMAIGRQLSDLAKAQNEGDLRAAGISKPSGLVSAATKVSDYKNSKYGSRSRGIGGSKMDSSSDDSDWESASDDDSDDSADSDLAFGTVVSAAIRPTAAAAAGAAAGAAMASGSRDQSGRSAVDPRLFGPVNSLHGMVTPRPFDDNGKPISREPRPLTRSATEPMGPMRNVYPLATSDPTRFDAMSGDLPHRARPGPVPLQQPTPRQTVSPKVYDAEKLEDATRRVDKSSRRSDESGWGGAAAAGVAAGLVGAALTKDRKEDKESRDYRDEEKRDREKRSERGDKREKEKEKEKRRDKDREREKDEKRKSKRDSYSSKYPEDKDRDKDRKLSSKYDDRDESKKSRDVVPYESTRDSYKRRDSSKFNLPAKYNVPQEPRQLPGPEKAGSYQATDPGKPVSKSAVDPFQYQVEDFAKAPSSEPPRPLTPNVFTVDREPVWDSTDDELPQGRLSRKDSFEIEQMVEENRKRHTPEEQHSASDYIASKAGHAVAPVGAAAMAGAIVAEGARSRDRKRNAYSDNGSEVRTRDAVQDEADKYYREAEAARKIASGTVRSRERSPHRSVVDKYDQDDNVRDVPTIVTPPEFKNHEHKVEEHHADFKIDNRWTPSEAARYTGVLNEPVIDAERERPYLNLIYPTPASSRRPTPAIEQQEEKSRSTDRDYRDDPEKDRSSKKKSKKDRDETSRSDVGSSKRRAKDRDERSSKSEVGVSSSRRRRTKDYEDETSKSDAGAVVVVGPDGDIQTAKSVSWGENRTDTFEVVTPEPREDREIGGNKTRPQLDKTSQWGAIATAIAANSREPRNEPDMTESPKEMDPGSRSRDMPVYHVEDTPPVPGPKPASPGPQQMPGTFADDIEFAATLAAGLEKTGFDANMVIDDPTYRRRDSPPGSDELNGNGLYQKPLSETVSDLHSREPQPGPSEPGFVLGEVETPGDSSRAVDPTDEWAEAPTKLSKKERKKQEKLRKQQEAEAAFETPVEAPEPPAEEETKLSKKEQRKRDKEARARALTSQDDEIYAEPEQIKEPETFEDAWEESSGKKKSRKSRDFDDGATSVSVPVEAYADLASSRDVNFDYDDDKKSKKSKRDSKSYDSMSKSVDDLRLSQRDDELDELKNSKKKSKRDSLIYDSPSRSVTDLSKIVDPEDEDNRKSRRKSKRDSGAYDSPSRSAAASEAGSEVSRKSSKKSKRKSGTEDDFNDYGDHPPDRGRDPFEDRDVSSVVSEPRDDKRSSRRSYRYDDDDDAKSVASAPGGSRKKVSEKRSSGGLFSSIFKKDDGNKSKESFLDNAGILGVGVGLAGAGIAAADSLSRYNATEALSEKKDPSEEIADWSRGVQDDFDSGITARTIKPAIDPQYGDLLPLPPSEPGSPIKNPEEELPSLPESRPDTPPEEQSFRYAHARRKSAQETPAKSPSNTAIPFQLRLGNRSGPSSPAFHKSSPVASPGMPESPGSTRKSRPTSWDDSHEYKPLYLLEHNRKGPQEDPVDQADLPALPPSEASSRSSPGPGSEAWESADEYAHGGYDETGYDEPTLRLDTSMPAFTPGHDRAGSQDTTPKAEIKPEFPDMSGAADPDPVEAMSKDRSSYLLQSAPSSTKSNKTVDNDTVARNLQEIAETPSKPGNKDSLADLDESLTSADEHFSDAREDERSPSRSRDLSDEVVTAPDAPAEQPSADATPAPEEPAEDLSMLTGKAKKKAKKAAKKKQAQALDVSASPDEPGTAEATADKDMPSEQAQPEAEKLDAASTEQPLEQVSEQPATEETVESQDAFETPKKGKKGKKNKKKASTWEDDLPTVAGAAALAAGATAAAIAASEDDHKPADDKTFADKEHASEPTEELQPDTSEEPASREVEPPTEEISKEVSGDDALTAAPGEPNVEPEGPAEPEPEHDSWEPTGKKSKKKKKKGLTALSLEEEPESVDNVAPEPEVKVSQEAVPDPEVASTETTAPAEEAPDDAAPLDSEKAAESATEPASEPTPEPATEKPEAWEATGKKSKKKKKKGKAPLPEVDEPVTTVAEPEATPADEAVVEDKSHSVEETIEPPEAAAIAEDESVAKEAKPVNDTEALAEPADDTWSAPPLSKKEKKKQKKKAALQTDDSWIKEAEEDVTESTAVSTPAETEVVKVSTEPATSEEVPRDTVTPTQDDTPAADEPVQAEEEFAPVSKKKKKKDKKKSLQLQLDTPEEPKLSDDKSLGTAEEPLTAIVATGDDASAWDQALEDKPTAPEIAEATGKDEDGRGLQPEISEPLFSQDEPSAATTQDPSTQASDILATEKDVSEPAEPAWEAPSSKKSKKDKKKKKKQEQQEEQATPKDESGEPKSEPAPESEAEVPAAWDINESQDHVEASYLEPIAEDEEVQADHEYERRYRPEELDWDQYENEAEPPKPEDDGWDMDDDFFSKPTPKEEVADDLGWDKPQTATDKDEPSEDEWSTLVTGKKAKKNKKKLSMEKALDLVQDPAAEASASGEAAAEPSQENQEQPAEDDWATPTKKSKKKKKKDKAAPEEASPVDESSPSPDEPGAQNDDALDASMQGGMSTPRPQSSGTDATEIWQEAESQMPEESKPEERPATTDDNDLLFPAKLSKKDKKKKKKQAALEAASAEDDKPAEASTDRDILDAESVAGTTDDSPENTSGFVTPAESVSGEANPDDEWGGFSSKKSKKEKKKKKAKDSEYEQAQEPTIAEAPIETPESQDRALDVPDDGAHDESGAAAEGSEEAQPSEQEQEVGLSKKDKKKKKAKALAFDVSEETSPETTSETQLNEQDPAQYEPPADDNWTSSTKDKKKKRKSVTFDLGETPAPGDEKEQDAIDKDVVSEDHTEGELPTSHQGSKDEAESEEQQQQQDNVKAPLKESDTLSQPAETEDQPAAEEVFEAPLSKKDKEKKKKAEQAAAAPEDTPAPEDPTANPDEGATPEDQSAQDAEIAAEEQELAELEARKAKKGRLVKSADRNRYNELKARSEQRAEAKAVQEAAALSEPRPSEEVVADLSRAETEPSTAEELAPEDEEHSPEEISTQQSEPTAPDTPADTTASEPALEPASAAEEDDSWMVGLSKSQIKKRKKAMAAALEAAALSESGAPEEAVGDSSRAAELETESSTPEQVTAKTEDPQTEEPQDEEPQVEESSPPEPESVGIDTLADTIAANQEPETAPEPEPAPESAPVAEEDDSWMVGLTKSQIKKRKKAMAAAAAEPQAENPQAEEPQVEESSSREPESVVVDTPADISTAEPEPATEPEPVAEEDDSWMVGLTKSQIKKRKKAMAAAAAAAAATAAAAEPEETPESAPVSEEAVVAEALPSEDQPSEEKVSEDKPLDKPFEDKPTEDKPAEDKPTEDKPAEDKSAREEMDLSPPEDVSKEIGTPHAADPAEPAVQPSEGVDDGLSAGLSKKEKKKKKKAAKAQALDDWEPATEPTTEPENGPEETLASQEVESQSQADVTPPPEDTAPAAEPVTDVQEFGPEGESLPTEEQPAESRAADVETPEIEEQPAEMSAKNVPAQLPEDDESWAVGLTKSQKKKRKKQMEKEKAEREAQEAAEKQAQDTLAEPELQPTSDSTTPIDAEPAPEPIGRASEPAKHNEVTSAEADEPPEIPEPQRETAAPVEAELVEDSQAEPPRPEEAATSQPDTATETSAAVAEDDESWAVGLTKSQKKKRKKQIEKEKEEAAGRALETADAPWEAPQPESTEPVQPADEVKAADSPAQPAVDPAAVDSSVTEDTLASKPEEAVAEDNWDDGLSKKDKKKKKKAKALAMDWDAPSETPEPSAEATATTVPESSVVEAPLEETAQPESLEELEPSQLPVNEAQASAPEAEETGHRESVEEPATSQPLFEEAQVSAPAPEEADDWSVGLSKKDKKKKKKATAQALEDEPAQPDSIVPTQDINEPTTAATWPDQPTIEPEAAVETSQEAGPTEPAADAPEAPTAAVAEDEDEFAGLSNKEKKKRKKAKALALAQAEAAKSAEPQPQEPSEASKESEAAITEPDSTVTKLEPAFEAPQGVEAAEVTSESQEAEAPANHEPREPAEPADSSAEKEQPSEPVPEEVDEFAGMSKKEKKKAMKAKQQQALAWEEPADPSQAEDPADTPQVEEVAPTEPEVIPETSQVPDVTETTELSAAPLDDASKPAPTEEDEYAGLSSKEKKKRKKAKEKALAMAWEPTEEPAISAQQDEEGPKEPISGAGPVPEETPIDDASAAVSSERAEQEANPAEDAVAEPTTTDTAPPEDDWGFGLSKKDKKKKKKEKAKLDAMDWGATEPTNEAPPPEEPQYLDKAADTLGASETPAEPEAPQAEDVDKPSIEVVQDAPVDQPEEQVESIDTPDAAAQRPLEQTAEDEWDLGLSKKDKKKKKKQQKAQALDVDVSAEPANDTAASEHPEPSGALVPEDLAQEAAPTQADEENEPRETATEETTVAVSANDTSAEPSALSPADIATETPKDVDEFAGLSKKEKKRRQKEKTRAMEMDWEPAAETVPESTPAEMPAESSPPREIELVSEPTGETAPAADESTRDITAQSAETPTEAAPEGGSWGFGLPKKDKKKKKKVEAVAMDWELAAETPSDSKGIDETLVEETSIDPAEPQVKEPEEEATHTTSEHAPELDPIPEAAASAKQTEALVEEQPVDKPATETESWDAAPSKKDKKKKKKGKALDLSAWDETQPAQPESSALAEETVGLKEPEDADASQEPSQEVQPEAPQTSDDTLALAGLSKKEKKKLKKKALAQGLPDPFAETVASDEVPSGESSSLHGLADVNKPETEEIKSAQIPPEEPTEQAEETEPIDRSAPQFGGQDDIEQAEPTLAETAEAPHEDENAPSVHDESFDTSSQAQQPESTPASEPQPPADDDWGFAVSTKKSKKDKKKKKQVDLDLGDPPAETEEPKDFDEPSIPAPVDTATEPQTFQPDPTTVPEPSEPSAANDEWAMPSKKSKKAKKLEASKLAIFEPQTEEAESSKKPEPEEVPSVDKPVENTEQPKDFPAGDQDVEFTPQGEPSDVVEPQERTKEETGTEVAEPSVEAPEAESADFWAMPSKKKSKKGKQREPQQETPPEASRTATPPQEFIAAPVPDAAQTSEPQAPQEAAPDDWLEGFATTKSKKNKKKSKALEEPSTTADDLDVGQEKTPLGKDMDNKIAAATDLDVVMDEDKLDEASSLSKEPQPETVAVYQQSWDFPSGSQDVTMAGVPYEAKEAPTTLEKQGSKDDESKSLDMGKATATGAAAAGIAAVAEKSTPGKKGKKGKKNKKSIDKRQPQEDDIFDDPSLWENADKRNLQENEEDKADDDFWGEGEKTKGQLAAKENNDFWGGGEDEDEVGETEIAREIGDSEVAEAEPQQPPTEPEEDPAEVAAEETGLQALEKKKAKKGKLAKSADRRRYDELKERASLRAEAQPAASRSLRDERSTPKPVQDYDDTVPTAQDAPRSLLTPTAHDFGAADRDRDKAKDLTTTPQTESFSGSDEGWKETAQRGAPLDDYDNDDSPILGRGEQATSISKPAGLLRRGADTDEPVGGLLREDSQAMALGGPLGSDFGGTRLSPARSLPGIQEVPEAEGEATTTRGLPQTPDLNRDSGYVESPRSSFRSRSRSHLLAEHGEQQQPRDSGYHDDDWEESPTRTTETPKSHKKHSSYSTPKLQEPAAPELTPEPEKKSSKSRRTGDHYEQSPLRSSTSRDLRDAPTLRSTRSRTERDLQASPSLRSMRSRDYGDLRSESAKKTSALPVATASSTSQRSVSDNVAQPRRQESQPQLRRSLSNTSLSRKRTPEPLKFRPESPGIHGQAGVRSTPTPPLRRVDKRVSGDLRSLRQQPSHPTLPTTSSPPDASSSQPQPQPVANEGRVRSKDMADVYDGFGEGRMGSPRSPTRPHSMRRRQSTQVLELESRVEQLLAENRLLTDARTHAEQNLSQRATSVLTERDSEIETLKQSLQFLQKEVSRLTEVNEGLSSANAELAQKDNGRYADLEVRHADVSRELDETRGAHNTFEQSLQDKDAEIADLRAQLDDAKEQVREMQRQILASKAGDSDFLDVLDEDHFDNRCQQLCSHVQQWVLRFSKFSDMRACRLTGEINDEKTIDRLDNAVLDGSDVDRYLSDRVKRRDIFMSMTMNMVWEFVFTRYLFGMDREQRQKLKSLEKMLTEVGPPQAVRQWRAVTLTLLARRDNFKQQKDQDTEAVVQAIFQTLCKILPPPGNLENQIQSQLRRVLREAVDLSIEMRTQKAEYMMLPPLQPEYDSEGELAATVQFNASMMNERSGKNASSNEDLEAEGAVVRVVLFPLVVKKGDDAGVGDEEIVVCPAQVVIASKGRRSFAPSSDAGGASLGGRSHMSVVTEHMV